MLRIFGRTPSLPAAGTKTYLQAISILLYLEDPWRVRTPSGIDVVVKRNRLGQIKILALAPLRPPGCCQRPLGIDNEVKRNLS